SPVKVTDTSTRGSGQPRVDSTLRNEAVTRPVTPSSTPASSGASTGASPGTVDNPPLRPTATGPEQPWPHRRHPPGRPVAPPGTGTCGPSPVPFPASPDTRSGCGKCPSGSG